MTKLARSVRRGWLAAAVMTLLIAACTGPGASPAADGASPPPSRAPVTLDPDAY